MIHGDSYSRIKYGNTTVDLEYSILQPTFFINNEIEQTSIITGKKSFIERPYSKEYIVTIFLSKYADKSGFVTSIEALRDKTLMFYPHSDYYTADMCGWTDVHLSSVEFYYLENDDTYDVCVLRLKSFNKEFGFIITEQKITAFEEKPIVTEDGDFIIEE